MHANLVLRYKIHAAFKKLCTPTVILRPVVHVQDQAGDQGKGWVQGGVPQIFEAIANKLHPPGDNVFDLFPVVR